MERIKNKINILGEYISYLFIISAFLNSKLNMKIGYVLVILGCIKFIFFRNEIKVNKKIYIYYLFLFILGIITNFVVSKYNGVNVFINENGKFFYAMFLFFFLLNKEKIKKINYSINIGILLLCCGIFQKNDWFMNGSYARQRGILIIGIVYLMIIVLESLFKKQYKEISIFTFMLSMCTMVSLNSRMAILVIFLSLGLYLFYIFLFKKEYNLKPIILGVFFITLVSYNFLPSYYIDRVKTSFNVTNNVSNEDRIVMWKAGLHIFKENYLLGIGASPKDIKPLLEEYVDKNIEKEYLRNEFIRDKKFSRLHNMYIDFFVQNGILALFYLVLLFILIPLEYAKSKKEQMETALFFSLIGFYIYGLTWSIWSDYGSIQMLFQIMLALLLIVIEIKNITGIVKVNNFEKE